MRKGEYHLKASVFQTGSVAPLCHYKRLKSKVSQVDCWHSLNNVWYVKSHIFISSGLLIAAIFLMRGLEALNEPGLGLREVYILGGFVVAGLLVHAGWKERKAR